MRKLKNATEHHTAILKKSGKQFVALCLELGVVGIGKTQARALRSLQAASASYQDYAADTGLPRTRPVALRELKEFLFF